jgi:hypothetical protein
LKYTAIFIAVVSFAPPLHAGDCAPAKTLKIVTADVSPTVPKDDFAAQPKILYRQGSRYARMEEAPDPEHKIHGLIIVAAPDSWIINLADRTARHTVDPDPKPVVRIPAFLPPDDSFPKELSALELGCEDSFFSAFKSPVTELKRDGVVLYKQAVGMGGWTVMLVRLSKDGVPDMLFLFRGDKIHSVIKYVSYETVDKPDPALFVKPDGVTIAETGPA